MPFRARSILRNWWTPGGERLWVAAGAVAAASVVVVSGTLWMVPPIPIGYTATLIVPSVARLFLLAAAGSRRWDPPYNPFSVIAVIASLGMTVLALIAAMFAYTLTKALADGLIESFRPGLFSALAAFLLTFYLTWPVSKHAGQDSAGRP